MALMAFRTRRSYKTRSGRCVGYDPVVKQSARPRLAVPIKLSTNAVRSHNSDGQKLTKKLLTGSLTNFKIATNQKI